MFARDLHVLLAILTIFAALIATLEGVVRTVRGRPAGVAAARTRTAVVMAVAMTATAGVVLLIRGKHPEEWLHILYAVFAFSLIPMADNAATVLKTNRGKALARVGGGLVCLLVIIRSFVTG